MECIATYHEEDPHARLFELANDMYKWKANLMRYRKKPVVIEAIQLLPVKIGEQIIDSEFCPDWLHCGGAAKIIENKATGYCVEINTLEGVMTAFPGDWIIQGVKGELYPCKNDIFLATYDKVVEVEINLENFIKAIKKRHFYFVRDCSMCHYPMTYQYKGDQLVIETGCNCVDHVTYEPVSEKNLESHLNPKNTQAYKYAKRFIEETFKDGQLV